MKKSLLALGLLLALQGCGGGGESGGVTTDPVTTETPTGNDNTDTTDTAVNTDELEVSENFDFRTDRDVEVRVGNQAPGTGIVNLYFDSSYHDQQNNIHYPDYATRVLSFDPSATESVVIQVSKNWDALYVEFVPTYPNGQEQYHKLELNAETSVDILFD